MSRDAWLPALAALAVGVAFLAIVYAAMGWQIIDKTRDAPFPKYEGSLPSDFYFTYSYGVGLDYTLSVASSGRADFTVGTCQGIIPQHATLALSQQELLSIWQSMQQNDFFEITEDFTNPCPVPFDTCVGIDPESRMTLQVTANGESKKIDFVQSYAMNNDNAQLNRFMAIVGSIDNVLANYENLPQTDCVYL